MDRFEENIATKLTYLSFQDSYVQFAGSRSLRPTSANSSYAD